MLTRRTPLVHQWALDQFKTFQSDALFAPFMVGKNTVIFPGFDGGAEWGGSALDPTTGLLYVNSNDIAWISSMQRTQSKEKEAAAGARSPHELKYNFTGYNKWYDPDGYPAVAPPWGTLNAINLNTGDYAWKIPLGEYPELAAQGQKDTGTENYGGPIVPPAVWCSSARRTTQEIRALTRIPAAVVGDRDGELRQRTPITYESR